MAKMKKKWVILCSTAVAAIYTAGYTTSETHSFTQQLPQNNKVDIQSNHEHFNDNLTNDNKTKISEPSSPQPSSAQNVGLLYKDGTYTGIGSNRRGSIEVAVTIKSDKITDVEISHFAMHYSERDVVSLPEEVVQKQSAQVSNVSGATYSTQAFEGAVQDALTQAENV